MLVRQQLEVVAHLQRDLLLGQHLAHWHQHEIVVAGQELGGDLLVLIVEEAAGGVHQPAAALEQARRAGQDGRLLDHQLFDRLGLLAPFDVGIAAQRAQA